MKTLALLLILLAVPAAAQNVPRVQPSRDVDVVYAITGPHGLLPQRLRWGVAQGVLRIDPPSPGLFAVIDIKAGRISTVREADHTVFETTMPAQSLPGVLPQGRFVRQDSASVAGLACTNWQTEDAAGQTVVACLTEDGVLLRAASPATTLLEAVEVTYGTLPEAVFRIPADYRKITPTSLSHSP